MHGHGWVRDSSFYFNLFDSVSGTEGKHEIGKLAPSVLEPSSLAPVFCPCSAVTLSERSVLQPRAGSPGEELPDESQHLNRTGVSLTKPAFCCRTLGLQINMGARRQPGWCVENRSVAHCSKLG